MKKLVLMTFMIFVGMFVISAHDEARSAEESVIKDYTFTWHVARTMIGGTTIEIQKTPEALVVIFGRTGIPLVRADGFSRAGQCGGGTAEKDRRILSVAEKD